MNEVTLLPPAPSQMKPLSYTPNDVVTAKIDWMKTMYGLTATEFRILECMARGKSPREIAMETHSAVSTVRTHINNIYRKTKVTKVVGLMALMITGPNKSL